MNWTASQALSVLDFSIALVATMETNPCSQPQKSGEKSETRNVEGVKAVDQFPWFGSDILN